MSSSPPPPPCGIVTSLMSHAQPAYGSPQCDSTQSTDTVATFPEPPASVDRTLPFPRLMQMWPYPCDPPVQYTADPRGGFLFPGCRSLVVFHAAVASWS